MNCNLLACQTLAGFFLPNFANYCCQFYVRVLFHCGSQSKLSDRSSLSTLSDNCNINDSLDHTQWTESVATTSPTGHSVGGPQQLWQA